MFIKFNIFCRSLCWFVGRCQLIKTLSNYSKFIRSKRNYWNFQFNVKLYFDQINKKCINNSKITIESALREAQNIGIAGTDPSLDINGSKRMKDITYLIALDLCSFKVTESDTMIGYNCEHPPFN